MGRELGESSGQTGAEDARGAGHREHDEDGAKGVELGYPTMSSWDVGQDGSTRSETRVIVAIREMIGSAALVPCDAVLRSSHSPQITATACGTADSRQERSGARGVDARGNEERNRE
jgi:hypothetical protein